MSTQHTIGVISDTHNLLRTEVLEEFAGCDLIIHAGDIGKEEVIEALEKIAPTVAVKGNCDWGQMAKKYPTTEAVEIGGKSIYVIHDIGRLDISLESDFDVIIYGHSHRPSIKKKRNAFLINPGSAGPRRFDLPISIAKLYISGKAVDAEIVNIKEKGFL